MDAAISKSSRPSEFSINSKQSENGSIKTNCSKRTVKTRTKVTQKSTIFPSNESQTSKSSNSRKLDETAITPKPRKTIFSTKNCIYSSSKVVQCVENGTVTDTVQLNDVGTRTCNDITLKISKIKATNTPNFNYKYALKRIRTAAKSVCTQISFSNLSNTGMRGKVKDSNEVEVINGEEEPPVDDTKRKSVKANAESKAEELLDKNDEDIVAEEVETKNIWKIPVSLFNRTRLSWTVYTTKICLIILILILMGVSTLLFIGMNVRPNEGGLHEHTESGRFLRGDDGLMRHESAVFV